MKRSGTSTVSVSAPPSTNSLAGTAGTSPASRSTPAAEIMHSYAIRWLPTSKQVSNTFGAKWPLAVMPPMGSRMSLLPAGVVLGAKSVEVRGRSYVPDDAGVSLGGLPDDGPKTVLVALHGVVDKPTTWPGYFRIPVGRLRPYRSTDPAGTEGTPPSRNRQPRPVVLAAEASSGKSRVCSPTVPGGWGGTGNALPTAAPLSLGFRAGLRSKGWKGRQSRGPRSR
jgi:hypothetical protein